jgi:hypothetical protein
LLKAKFRRKLTPLKYSLRVCLNPIWSKALHNFLARSATRISLFLSHVHTSITLVRFTPDKVAARNPHLFSTFIYILLRRSCAGFFSFPQHLIPSAAVCFFIRSSKRGLFRRAWPPSIQYNSAHKRRELHTLFSSPLVDQNAARSKYIS